ncbi:sporulation protein YqfD [Alicyclobacillus tolerans]|uniref:Sporulation protein YqfD n=1 Tax=Alicyclobacillus tolerans TaxID=90970 RepID=A0ABT9LSY7_9BACL|nr:MULTISPECIES: sporulation protein YqfD [Alicyclobacillus]MDP9727380.1 hypothetical protein [Alicyclobacillus tengchongensis]QRF23118.1 sporulation protein YqfD [Alicyclobacillus sp. TC]
MKKPWLKWFPAGSVILELRGERRQEVLTLLHRAGVKVRSIQFSTHTLRLHLDVREIGLLYTFCRRTQVKFRVLERRGGIFILRRLWQRRVFAGGAILFVCLLYGLSQMVWRVDIQAPNEAIYESVQEAAQDSGLYVGAFQHHLPPLLQLQEEIRQQSKDVVWVGVRMEGSVAKIQVIPKIEAPKALNQTPVNIVISKPAVILHVYATRGLTMVRDGQTVMPGQVAISGTLADGAAQVSASGDVLGEVWYTSIVQVPLKVSQGRLTGEYVTRYYLRSGQFLLRVWGFREPDYHHVLDVPSQTDWRLGQYVLPIQWETVRRYEVSPSLLLKSQQKAEAEALQLARSDVATQIGEEGHILGQTVLHRRVERGTLYETILTRTEENVGVPAPIPPVTSGENGSSPSTSSHT